MHNEQFHSFVQFIHSFILPKGTMHTYMPPSAYTRYCTIIPPPPSSSSSSSSSSLFFILSFFFSYLYAYVCSIVIENLFKTRAHTSTFIYIASIHTNIVTSTYVSIIFYHLFFLLLSIYLALFMVLTYNFFSSKFYYPHLLTGKTTKHSCEDLTYKMHRLLVEVLFLLFF